jgi:hypothetical protein
MESTELLLLLQENISENWEPTSIRMDGSSLFILNVLITDFALLLHVAQRSWKCEMYFSIWNIQYCIYILSPSSLFLTTMARVGVKDIQSSGIAYQTKWWTLNELMSTGYKLSGIGDYEYCWKQGMPVLYAFKGNLKLDVRSVIHAVNTDLVVTSGKITS